VITLLSIPSPPSPILVELGPLALRYYGLLIALGIAVGTWLAGKELARRGHAPELALDSLLYIIPPGFIGARLYHVITDYELYANNFSGVFAVWNGGLGIYGAVAGGLLGAYVFCRVRNLDLLTFADSVAPGLIIGQAIGRWGNYFNQELFGLPSDLPWAIRIAPENRPAGFEDATAFHPTFLYESLWNLAIGLSLLWVARRFATGLKDGDIFVLYVSLYSLGRFFMELLRIDRAFFIGEGFRGNLLVSSLLALCFALVFVMRHARGTSGRKPGDSGPGARGR
jgi:prolipoprotein diacylglyceryl transferase